MAFKPIHSSNNIDHKYKSLFENLFYFREMIDHLRIHGVEEIESFNCLEELKDDGRKLKELEEKTEKYLNSLVNYFRLVKIFVRQKSMKNKIINVFLLLFILCCSFSYNQLPKIKYPFDYKEKFVSPEMNTSGTMPLWYYKTCE